MLVLGVIALWFYAARYLTGGLAARRRGSRFEFTALDGLLFKGRTAAPTTAIAYGLACAVAPLAIAAGFVGTRPITDFIATHTEVCERLLTAEGLASLGVTAQGEPPWRSPHSCDATWRLTDGGPVRLRVDALAASAGEESERLRRKGASITPVGFGARAFLARQTRGAEVLAGEAVAAQAGLDRATQAIDDDARDGRIDRRLGDPMGTMLAALPFEGSELFIDTDCGVRVIVTVPAGSALLGREAALAALLAPNLDRVCVLRWRR